jgi:hypothetical protein
MDKTQRCMGLAQMIHVHAAQVVTISTIKHAKTTVKRSAHRKCAKIEDTSDAN